MLFRPEAAWRRQLCLCLVTNSSSILNDLQTASNDGHISNHVCVFLNTPRLSAHISTSFFNTSFSDGAKTAIGLFHHAVLSLCCSSRSTCSAPWSHHRFSFSFMPPCRYVLTLPFPPLLFPSPSVPPQRHYLSSRLMQFSIFKFRRRPSCVIPNF